jgi:hypothetical protein
VFPSRGRIPEGGEPIAIVGVPSGLFSANDMFFPDPDREQVIARRQGTRQAEVDVDRILDAVRCQKTPRPSPLPEKSEK